jgi:two-component system response regulator RegA
LTERILLVDDDERFRERLARAFSDRGYAVSCAGDHPSALAEAEAAPPDRAVVDLRMPGASGLEVVRDLRERWPRCLVVVLTGYGSVATAVDAVRLGACNYLHKPAHAGMILAAFEHGTSDPTVEAEPAYEPPNLARNEWEHIQRVLADCGGNVSAAARKLGLHRRTLQRKLGKHAPPE